MGSSDRERFRLTVLNPGGRDREQRFDLGAPLNEAPHAPVNFHAYAACTAGSFQHSVRRASAEETPALVLLRGDFRASFRAVSALKLAGRKVAVSLKETGLHQIASQLGRASAFARFNAVVREAHGCIAATPEAADLYRAIRGSGEGVVFIPTPYPIDDLAWDFSRPLHDRAGIFVGTREWNVPSRNHLLALLVAHQISSATGEGITVFNAGGAGGARLLREIVGSTNMLRVLDRRLRYPDYLRELSRHKIVLQFDTSFVPGQVAGDALLCRMPCVGGNGAIDRIAFPHSSGWSRSPDELMQLATDLCRDPNAYAAAVADSQARAAERLSFQVIARELERFFASLS